MGLLDRFVTRLGYTPNREVPGQIREAADRVVRDYSLAWPTPMLWGLFGGSGSSTGVPITPLSSLQVSTVYMCVKRLSEDIASLPVTVQRLKPGHGWSDDLDHPFNVLLAKPNRWMTPFEFWRYMVMSLELRGNAIAVIKRGWDGAPEELIPLNWDRVSPLLSPSGLMFYNVSHPQIGWGVTFSQDDIIHIRGLTVDGGYLGMTPIAVAQDVIGLGVAMQQHGAVFFRQGAQTPKAVKHPGKLSKEAAERIAQSLANTHGGVQNFWKWLVLEEGMDAVDLGMTNEDSQFVQGRNFQIPEICRMFGVPPPKVFHYDKATYSTLEQTDQEYVASGIKPRTVNIRDAFGTKVFFADEWGRFRINVNFSELLQGDMKSQAEFLGSQVNNGIMSRNEARAMRGLPPVPGGDIFRVPGNTSQLDANGIAPPPKPGAGAPGGLGSDVNSDKANGMAPLSSETADQAVV